MLFKLWEQLPPDQSGATKEYVAHFAYVGTIEAKDATDALTRAKGDRGIKYPAVQELAPVKLDGKWADQLLDMRH